MEAEAGEPPKKKKKERLQKGAPTAAASDGQAEGGAAAAGARALARQHNFSVSSLRVTDFPANHRCRPLAGVVMQLRPTKRRLPQLPVEADTTGATAAAGDGAGAAGKRARK